MRDRRVVAYSEGADGSGLLSAGSGSDHPEGQPGVPPRALHSGGTLDTPPQPRSSMRCPRNHQPPWENPEVIERQVDFTYRRGALIQVIEYGVADRSPDGNGIVRQESAGWPSSGTPESAPLTRTRSFSSTRLKEPWRRASSPTTA